MKSKYVLVSLTLLALVAAACTKESQPAPQTDTSKMENGGSTLDDSMMHDDEVMQGDSMAKEDAGTMMKKAGAYVAYSPAALAEATKDGGKAVLFFHASWCPECRAADKEFTANPSVIPAGVTVIKTDYDSMTDLKKKYGVIYQHTFVQVDAAGAMITKWNSEEPSQVAKRVK